jgi:hypothetical protein
MSATVVSAYYMIKSKLPSSKYVEWISNFMKLDMKCVIFTNKYTFENVFKNAYPSSFRRIYKIVEISEFEVSSYDWEKDYDKDHEKHVGHSPELYKVWAEKSFFLKKVIEENPFVTEYFFWNDIGLFRFNNLVGLLKDYPNVSNIENKIYMTLVNLYSKSEFANLSVCDERFRYVNRIAGGNFGGHKDVLLKFIDEYKKTLEEFDRLNLFKGKDQSLYSWMIVRNPDMFNLVSDPKYSNTPIEWFYLYIYLK